MPTWSARPGWRAVAQVWEAFLRYEARGVRLDTGLLVHMARLRATDLGRRFVRGGQPRRDVMDFRNYLDGRTQVLHLDGLEDENEGWSGEGDVGLQAAWQAATSADPAEELVATIDLDGWLGSLGADDRDLLAGRLAGHSLQELAWAHRPLDHGRVPAPQGARSGPGRSRRRDGEEEGPQAAQA